MKKVTLIVIFLLIANIQVKAQNFDTVLSAISENLVTVKTAKKEYIQSIEAIEPGVVKLTIEVLDSKGKSTVNQYEFNTSDIDINTVKTITKKDLLHVQLLASKKQKLIKKITNQEKISYVNSVSALAENIDNGRLLEEAFKKSIPVAKEITNKRLSLNSMEDRLAWLSSNIGDVTLIKKQFTQSFIKNDKFPGSVIYNVAVASGKSAKSNEYQFNLSTINPNSILFKIEGEVFSVLLESRGKLKTIKELEDKEQQSYTKKIKIVCTSIENARDVQKVLKDLIPLSKKAFKNAIKKISSISQGLEQVNNTIKLVTINDLSIKQNFTGECVVDLQTETIDSDDSTVEVFSLNLSDLNKNGIKYLTKGKKAYLELFINGGNKFVKYQEDGEQKNYVKSFKIYTPEIEDAIILKNTFSDLIDLCKTNMKDTFKTGTTDQLITALQTNLKKVTINDTSYEQKLEVMDEDNTLKYTKTIITTKSSKEHINEFNLSDLNPSSIKMKTSGKKVMVIANTFYLEKIIKIYQDGKIKNYKKDIEFQANDIENARELKRILRELTKEKK